MANEHKDYYKILGITRKSTADEIKAAYRRLAMKYHPDRNQGDESAKEKFQAISEAYDILSDKDKKTRYDAECAVRKGANSFTRFAGDWVQSVKDWEFAQKWAKAQTMKGNARAADAPMRGADVSTECDIDLEDVIFGGKVDVVTRVAEECGDCHGTGCKCGTGHILCPLCGGTGMLVNGTGYYQVRDVCQRCKGTGKVPERPCEGCKGQGVKSVMRKFTISVPSGVDTGTSLRLAGRGNAGLRGGERGDLYVTVCVREHELFKRQGYNLLADIPVSPFVTALGGEVVVHTPDGAARLKIPAGTPNGKTFKMQGKGILAVKGGFRGDLILTIRLETPTVLTNSQRAALEYARDALARSNFPDAAKAANLGGMFLERMRMRKKDGKPNK